MTFWWIWWSSEILQAKWSEIYCMDTKEVIWRYLDGIITDALFSSHHWEPYFFKFSSPEITHNRKSLSNPTIYIASPSLNENQPLVHLAHDLLSSMLLQSGSFSWLVSLFPLQNITKVQWIYLFIHFCLYESRTSKQRI